MTTVVTIRLYTPFIQTHKELDKMSLEMIPYFMMNGKAKEAITFYEKILDAKLVFIHMDGDKVDHAVLKIGESQVMISDLIEQITFQKGNQVNICITTTDRQRAEKIYQYLTEEGKILLPMCEMPFSPAYGIVIDKFGICFQVSTQVHKHI
jgi:PhnB protein